MAAILYRGRSVQESYNPASVYISAHLDVLNEQLHVLRQVEVRHLKQQRVTQERLATRTVDLGKQCVWEK